LHREFKKLLEKAKGVSELIVAIFIDVRGFSSFSKTTDHYSVGLFVRQIYRRIIDEYFPNSTFFKPTGDGLLVVLAYDEHDVRDVVSNAIMTCSKIVEDFGTFLKSDPLINFPTPTQVGIGVARGAATRLESEEKILDYSGHILNVAARITALARPTGVVLDSSVGVELVSEEVRKNMSEAQVYPRGIADSKPITVYYDKRFTRTPVESMRPLNEVWETARQKETRKDFQKMGLRGPAWYWVLLGSKPSRPDLIRVEVVWKENSRAVGFDFKFFKYAYARYKDGALAPQVTLDIHELIAELKHHRIKADTELTIVVDYPTIRGE
jgi:class 3 adenylate cyclase